MHYGFFNWRTFFKLQFTQNLKSKFREENSPTGKFSHLDLLNGNQSLLDLSEFKKKVCVKIESKSENYCFSVYNIIYLLSNKHGGSHLDYSYDSDEKEAFYFAEFNPFSISSRSIYLILLSNISEIVLKSLEPLALEIQKNLKDYDRGLIQIQTSMNTNRE